MKRAGLALVMIIGLSSAAAAQTCGNDARGFPAWLESFKQRAVASGISPQVVQAALAGVTYNPRVVQLDRNQRSFRLSFEEFYARRVNNAMINQGKRLIQQHRALFDQLERTYGVPPEILVAIWGLETGFGRDVGNMSVIRSLATLAYDCRRTEFFTNELIHALMIVQRGDMRPD
jgi:membrane-bound lytic murein transglycosylase B